MNTPEARLEAPLGDAVTAWWIGPLRPPRAVRRGVVATAGFALPLLGCRTLPAAAAAAGALPFLVSYATGTDGHALLSALALALLVLAAVRQGAWSQGVIAIACGFLAHSATVIAVSHRDPSGAAVVLAGGPAYWEKQRTWIATGHDPEYEVANWLPAHGAQLGGVVLYGYTSLGATALFLGIHEVDLMNFYVARLISESASGPLALAAGWHIWSLARGVGFAFVLVAVIGTSYERLAGTRAIGRARLRQLLAIGVCFLALDCALKYTATERVRAVLSANLVGASEGACR